MTNLLFSTGIRQQSMMNLTIRDVDLDNQMLNVCVTKNTDCHLEYFTFFLARVMISCYTISKSLKESFNRKGGILMKLRCFVLFLFITLFCWINACAETVTFNSTTSMLHVEYDQCLPGEVYAFICVTGTDDTVSLTGDNVYYLYQLKADVTGCIRVAIVGQVNKQYSFWLGGRFADQVSPVKIGTFNANKQHLPAALTVIGDEAFMGTQFQLLYLEDGITTIGARAFMECANLNFIYIPKSVKSIGEDAFSGCPNVVICCEVDSAAYQYALDRGLTIEIHQGGEES